MTYVYALDHEHDLPPEEVTALIGGKAAGLAMMTTELGLPVPPGFAITTQAWRSYVSEGWPQGLDAELAAAMRRLEEQVGRRFGGRENPLVVSVRSGAPVSMPGMMDTILNLGLNDETEHALATVSGDPGFAADCRRRFNEMFTKVVGIATVPEDPWQQLRAAVEAVFRSWNSDRARAYRLHEGIADDMGTAVTVQAMVFGNWGADSATGVLFTRNPATGEPSLYGDVLFASQGEDVVAGTHHTEPIDTLDSRLPEVASSLRRYSDSLERHFADLCDIEFTIEQGKLWLLQVRVGKRSPRAALRMAVDMAQAADFPLSRAEAVKRTAAHLRHPPMVSIARSDGTPAMARGLPASPGVATGEIATTSASALAAVEAGRPVILVRSETSPADVQGMARSAGILTSRGGLVSHAAVVARGWGIPAVVGAEAVNVDGDAVDVSGLILRTGDTITIDGSTGEIFAGVVAGSTTVAPEAATLRGWAKELGIDFGEAKHAPSAAGSSDDPPGECGGDDIIRALLITGGVSPGALAATLLSTPEHMSPLLEDLSRRGLIERGADEVRLTPSGKSAGIEQIAADRHRWGKASAEAALEAFVALDHHVKEAVTSWQLRDVEGTQVLNDHIDPAYDAGVLSRLAELNHDAAEWLASIGEAPAALHRYGKRLERALASARGGDQRYVASPRVDSFHSVWFELHEELIQLAGRNRSEEAAAGRA